MEQVGRIVISNQFPEVDFRRGQNLNTDYCLTDY